MKTSLSNVLVAFAALWIGGAALHAQSFKYEADVPFAFHAGKSELEAGKYIIDRPFASSVEWMRSTEGSTRVAVTSAPQSMEKPGKARLVFRHLGSQYYLTQIWNSEGKGTTVPKTKSEKALEERMALTRADTVTVYLASAR